MTTEIKEGRRFHEPYQMECRGHFCWFWGDDHSIVSHAECDCATKWKQDSTDAQWLVDAWRDHYQAVHYKTGQAY